MTKKELKLLSDEELKEIAKRKGKKGNATTDAKKAQEILYERNGEPFSSRLCQDLYGSKCFASADTITGWSN